MGLDDFVSGSTSRSTSKSTTNQNQKQSDTEEEQEDETHDPFKVVTDSKGRSKVFNTEEDWEETAAFIESEMNMTIAEVMNMNSIERHETLHKAILQIGEGEQGGFQPTKHCVVCGEKFIFPKKWAFVEIENEATCPGHKIGEVMESLSNVQSFS